jgi:hypothetical protein
MTTWKQPVNVQWNDGHKIVALAVVGFSLKKLKGQKK